MAYHLGIDLGTTYTAAAAERAGVVEALTLGNRTASVPSVVYLRDDGELLVGEAATRRADAIAFGGAIAVASRHGSATPESVTTVLADHRPPPPTRSADATGLVARPAPPPGARPAPPAATPLAATPPAVTPLAATPPAATRPAPPAAPAAARPSPPARPAPPTAASRPAPPAAAVRPAPPASRAAAAAAPAAGAAPPPAAGANRAGVASPAGHPSGGHPVAPATSRSLADSKALWIGLGIVAVVAVIVIVVALAGGGDESGGSARTGERGSGGDASAYTQQVEDGFMGSCTVRGGQAQCECAWDAIVEQVAFDRFVEIEEELTAAGSEVDLADYPELASIFTDCTGAT